MRNAHFKLNIDEAHKVLTFRFVGDGVSSDCADQLLDQVANMNNLGDYKQVWDYRHFTSILEPSDVERIAQHWRNIDCGRPIPTAVVARDPLTPARAKAFASLFPMLDIHNFRELYLAMDWLESA
jgi:hypothetical protein